MSPVAPPVAPASPPPRKLGCWFYGCTALFVLTILGLVGIYFGGRYVVRQARDAYTASQPAALPEVEISASEWTNLQQRIDVFAEALEKGESKELVLTEREINAFLANDPKLTNIAERVHVTIKDDQLGGQVSFPIPEDDVFQMLGLSGRYFNGTATFDVSLSDGNLHVYLEKLEVNGKPVPDELMTEFRKKDLAQDVRDPDARAAIRKYESVNVEDGKLILKSKGSDDSPAPPGDPEP